MMTKKPAGFTTIEIVITLVVVALVAAGGYILYHQDKSRPKIASHQTQASTSATPSATPPQTSTPSATPKPTSAPKSDDYAGWKTYTHPNGYFSFKYPPGWTVQRQVVSSQDNSDYVHIYAESLEVAQLARYADGVGSSSNGNCQPLFHDMPLGATSIKLVGNTCGGWYSSGAKITSLQSNSANIVLATVANNFIMIRAAYGKGYDAQLDQWGRSMSGIVPPVGY